MANMMGKTLIHEMGHFLGLFHTFHEERKDVNGKAIDLECDDVSLDGCDQDRGLNGFTGDGISDTPAQKICHFNGCGTCVDGKGVDPCKGCLPAGAVVEDCDTCPDAGLDPVKNFMGYNPDICMDHFTHEQYTVMQANFQLYRKYLDPEEL